MSVGDFPIPSLLREFRDWPAPWVASDAGDLLVQVGVGAAGDPRSGLSELLSSLLEALEPTLILLSLCGHPATRLLVAGADTQVAVLLGLNDAMTVTSMDRMDWPPPVTDELTHGGAVVGLELSDRSPLAVRLTGLREGWFPAGVPTANPALDLADLLGELAVALSTVQAQLLVDVASVVSAASVGDLVASPDVASGLLTIFDPTGWFVRSLANPDDDALAAGDADAVALIDLGQAMMTRIDAVGVEGFLREEIERDRATRMPLRHRFDDGRDDRQLLRRGLRGARRRHRVLEPDHIQRGFRLGRSRTLTYTEVLLGCHVEGVVDLLHRLNLRDLVPRLEFEGDLYGEPSQRYLIARLPPPHQALDPIELVLVNPPSAPGGLSISYRRWGHEHGVAGEVNPTMMSLATGRLPQPMHIVDGEEDRPTLTIYTHHPLGEPDPDDDFLGDEGAEVLRVSGIQHGDVLVFTDTVSGTTAELAIVKNFSRNDLNRLHAAGFGLSLAQPFGGLGGLPDLVIDTITFILADGPGTAQDDQRRALETSLANTYPQARADPTKAYPATLDVPSSRGIGILPDDASHTHLCAPTIAPELETAANTYRADIAAAAGGFEVPDRPPYHESPQLRSEIGAHREAAKGALANVVDQLVRTAGASAIWHTYEFGEAMFPLYLLADNAVRLWPGDPVRNIRTDRGAAPKLFNVLALNDAIVGIAEQQLTALLQVDLFVNRRAEVELYVAPELTTSLGGSLYGQALQIADALASLADGGLLPPGVNGGSDDPAPPPPPVDEPDEPTDSETHLGAALLQVVDDAGSPLPLARVSITGAATLSVKTANDGTFLLSNQATGRYFATTTHYPHHEAETVAYNVVPDSTTLVELVLARIPPDPELPPLRGVIAETCGFFVRVTPGRTAQKLGKLHYHELNVTVLAAREVHWRGPPIADVWLLVRFTPDDFHSVVVEYEAVLNSEGDSEAIALHAAAVEANQGTEAWVGIGGFAAVAMPWDHFLRLLADFETTHADEELLTRLSRLRQIGEEADVPANDVVGAGADVEDQINLADRPFDPHRWSLLFEAKQVELPDGEIVDIHHFLLGVEAGIDDGRRSDDRTIHVFGYPLRMGESYAAVTWSGDVGAGPAGMVRHDCQDWEDAALFGRSEDDTIRLYFSSSAPDFDLLPDIDSWGASGLVPLDGNPPPPLGIDSLVGLVTRVYGPAGKPTAEHAFAKSANRAEGIRAILSHYGFTSATGLLSQGAAVDLVEEQVVIVALTFFTIRAARDLIELDLSSGLPQPTAEETQAMTDLSALMTRLFLQLLEDLARQLGVTL